MRVAVPMLTAQQVQTCVDLLVQSQAPGVVYVAFTLIDMQPVLWNTVSSYLTPHV